MKLAIVIILLLIVFYIFLFFLGTFLPTKKKIENIDDLNKLNKKQAEELKRIEDAKKQAEELKKIEDAKKQAEELKKIEDAKKQAEELKKIKDAKKQAEELKRIEDAKKQAEELKRIEDAKKQAEELKRIEDVKKQAEELKKIKDAKKQAEELIFFKNLKQQISEQATFEVDLNKITKIKSNFRNKLYSRSYSRYNIKYYYLFDYLSNNMLENVDFNTAIFRHIRSTVFQFKDGIYSRNLVLFIAQNLIQINKDIYNNPNFYVCAIPSSKIDITYTRYKRFLEDLSSELKINNGFNLIKRVHDIDKSIQNGIKKDINVLDGIEFSEVLKDKKVILIDDVITKGNSLKNFYNSIKDIKTKEIIPFFISRTYFNLDNYTIENEYNINNLSFLNSNVDKISELLKTKYNSYSIKFSDNIYPIIRNKFNQAVYKINNSNEELGKIDYLSLFESNLEYRKNIKNIYIANNIKDYNDALILLKEILIDIPNHILTLDMISICYRFLGYYNLSINYSNTILCFDDKYVAAYNNRGNAKINLNAKRSLSDYIEAIEDYTKAIEIDNKYTFAYHNRGILKRNLKDYKGAIEDYTKIIEIDNQNVDAYNNRGNAKSDLKDYKGAIEDYTKAIEIDNKYTFAYNNRGNAKSDLKDYKGAIEDYTKIIEIDNQNVDAYNNRGNAKSDLKDYKGAIEDYTKVIEIDNQNVDAYNNRELAKKYLKKYN